VSIPLLNEIPVPPNVSPERTDRDLLFQGVPIGASVLPGLRGCKMARELQVSLEGYIPECIPADKIPHVRYWFDVYDLGEGRM
jgi:hypothetical protein